jgi:hypothetical protein
LQLQSGGQIGAGLLRTLARQAQVLLRVPQLRPELSIGDLRSGR